MSAAVVLLNLLLRLIVELAFDIDMDDVEEFRDDVDVVEEVSEMVLFSGFFSNCLSGLACTGFGNAMLLAAW